MNNARLALVAALTLTACAPAATSSTAPVSTSPAPVTLEERAALAKGPAGSSKIFVGVPFPEGAQDLADLPQLDALVNAGLAGSALRCAAQEHVIWKEASDALVLILRFSDALKRAGYAVELSNPDNSTNQIVRKGSETVLVNWTYGGGYVAADVCRVERRPS
ncbi:outer membrane protein TolC [Deinobacterium chartae]|uniref:Outer membrane protein TolC n=1 Tax=Deinobacterium chartae TaxID=521158 RepID=A0A841I4K1_9DEIO|nr:hypothetical protein [Deinobacterium chartae]MBB6099340.1 outer membrane protein TolC [Deinobacterium chartae]